MSLNYQMFAGAITPAYLPLVNFGPVGTADDSATWVAAMNAAKTEYTNNKVRSTIIVPPGTTTIGIGTPLPNMTGVPYGIVGYGSWKSNIYISPSYSGDVFWWSNCWVSSSISSGHNLNLSTYAFGPQIQGISITGDTSAASVQNAITFYDLNDFIYMSDVQIRYLNGSGIRSGKLKNAISGTIRESIFDNVTLMNCGTATQAAWDIDCNGTPDATNTIHINMVRIFGSAGVGMLIQNNATTSAVRGIHINDGTFEGLQSGTSQDSFAIYNGDTTGGGGINNISLSQCEFFNPGTGYSCLKLSAAPGASFMYFIDIQGHVGSSLPGSCIGFNLLNGRGVKAKFWGVDVGLSNTAINVGPASGGVGPGNYIENPYASGFTIAIDPTSLGYVSFNGGMQFANSSTGSNTATLTNAPIAGNPTKWVPVYDPVSNTTRYSPLW